MKIYLKGDKSGGHADQIASINATNYKIDKCPARMILIGAKNIMISYFYDICATKSLRDPRHNIIHK